jgi:hypothetical protein
MSLDGVVLTFFRSFHHKDRADHLRGCGNVEQQLEEGQVFLPKQLMKRPGAAIMPVSFMTPFFPVSPFILWIASTLVRFALMPR